MSGLYVSIAGHMHRIVFMSPLPRGLERRAVVVMNDPGIAEPWMGASQTPTRIEAPIHTRYREVMVARDVL